MSRQLRRTVTAHLPVLSQQDGARTTRWEVPPGGSSVCEIQLTKTPALFKELHSGRNLLIPPLHWHWNQDEFFEIKQGRYIFDLEGRSFIATPTSGLVKIPKTARHTFRVDPTCEEDCQIIITASPEDCGVSERYFRNIYSYRDDCYKQNIKPSLPQLLLIQHEAEISLAMSGPALPMQWISWLMGWFVGKFVGQYLLGYKASYEEYYDPKVTKRA